MMLAPPIVFNISRALSSKDSTSEVVVPRRRGKAAEYIVMSQTENKCRLCVRAIAVKL